MTFATLAVTAVLFLACARVAWLTYLSHKARDVDATLAGAFMTAVLGLSCLSAVVVLIELFLEVRS